MPVVTGTQYASQTDLAQLGLAPGALQNVTGTVQDAALLAASALADSYLESRYKLPLTSWGKDLSRIVCFIAAYDILTSRGYSPQSPDDHIRQRYIDALAWLQEVSRGTQSPSQIADSSVTTQTGPSIGAVGSDGSINSATAGGFQMVTSPVRGWTSRGGSSVPSGGSGW